MSSSAERDTRAVAVTHGVDTVELVVTAVTNGVDKIELVVAVRPLLLTPENTGQLNAPLGGSTPNQGVDELTVLVDTPVTPLTLLNPPPEVLIGGVARLELGTGMFLAIESRTLLSIDAPRLAAIALSIMVWRGVATTVPGAPAA